VHPGFASGSGANRFALHEDQPGVLSRTGGAPL